MNKANILSHIPTDLPEEVFEDIINHKKVKIERIISKGQVTPINQWYDQIQNEWVMLVNGSAVIQFQDDQEISLSKGDYINIPAGKKHRVSWTDPECETIWLAVHY